MIVGLYGVHTRGGESSRNQLIYSFGSIEAWETEGLGKLGK